MTTPIAQMLLIGYTSTPATAGFGVRELYASGFWPEDIADMCRMRLSDVQAYLNGAK